MNIKDFKVGQTAYVLGDGRRLNDGKARAVEVIKVGRKYVTVTEPGIQETRFFESVGSTDFLVEDKDWGHPMLLFLTSESVEEYNELTGLRSWVQEATNWLNVKNYTLAQLREVKKILKG